MLTRRVTALITVVVCALMAAPASGESLDQLLHDDMTLPHEVLPHGVPAFWSWAQQPFVSPPAPVGYTAFTAWGLVYRCANDAYDSDDYVQIADVQTWMLDATGWHQYQAGFRLEGAAFPEDFSRNQIAPGYQSRGESWVNVRQIYGRNYHFWPRDRAPLNATVKKIVVLARARWFGQGARNSCVGLSMGGDYWQSMRALYPSVTGAGVGRVKRVDSAWRVFSMTLDLRPSSSLPYPFSFAAAELR
jgi:hypothetical protein